jgi:hypothetical protein
MTFMLVLLARHEREQRDHAGTLHGDGQRALVARAVAGDAARKNLAAFRDVLAQPGLIFVVDRLLAVDAERADLPLGTPLFLGSALGLRFGGSHGLTFM